MPKCNEVEVINKYGWKLKRAWGFNPHDPTTKSWWNQSQMLCLWLDDKQERMVLTLDNEDKSVIDYYKKLRKVEKRS